MFGDLLRIGLMWMLLVLFGVKFSTSIRQTTPVRMFD